MMSAHQISHAALLHKNPHDDHLMGEYGYMSLFIIQHSTVRSSFLRKNELSYGHSRHKKSDFQDGVQFGERKKKKNNASHAEFGFTVMNSESGALLPL